MIKIDSFDLSTCTKNNFDAIDVMKLLCSFLVVALHVAPFGFNKYYITDLLNYIANIYVTRIAVPFFFICTGFLVFRKTNLSAYSISVGIKYAKKIYKLYIIWTIIYLPLTICNFIDNDTRLTDAVLIFIRNFIIADTYKHLWYLNASAFAVLLISYLLHKKIRLSRILVLASILYFIGLLPQSYFGLFKLLSAYPLIWNSARIVGDIIVTTRNGLFDAFIFVAIGMILAFKPIHLSP